MTNEQLQLKFNEAMAEARREKLKGSPQLLLGDIIAKLELVENKELPLFIDIDDARPMGIDSWRGVYAELAIQTTDFGAYNTDVVSFESSYGNSYEKKSIGCKNPTVSQWIEVLKEAVGKTFEGYKGGDFLMDEDTPVYLAEYSDSRFMVNGEFKNVYFVGVVEQEDKVYLVTAIEDEE